MLKKLFDARVQELWNLYEATGELKHPGEKGLLRELFLRRVIESILPPHFAVGSGVIIDKWGRQSMQSDLLVYDRRMLPPLLEEQGHGIYPMDSVLRVIEVKSTLNKAGLEEASKAAWLLNPKNPDGLKVAMTGNLENGQMYYPLFGIFAYESSIKSIQDVVKDLSVSFSDSVMIAVMKRGIYLKGWQEEMKYEGIQKTTRRFVTLFLQCLEDAARSRQGYSLAEWLLD